MYRRRSCTRAFVSGHVCSVSDRRLVEMATVWSCNVCCVRVAFFFAFFVLQCCACSLMDMRDSFVFVNAQDSKCISWVKLLFCWMGEVDESVFGAAVV